MREKKICFQTQFPAKLWVFNEGEVCVYSMAQEATTDMVRRGLQVKGVKPAESSLERIKCLTGQSSREEPNTQGDRSRI